MAPSTAFAGRSRVVAVAGCTGGVGRHVTEQLVAAGLHVVLLLRKSSPELVTSLQSLVPSVTKDEVVTSEVVDFRSKDVLSAMFKKHTVDTVLSTIFIFGEEMRQTEEVLLEAALDSGVRRFSPSCWATAVEKSLVIKGYKAKVDFMARIQEANISWTHFATGIFMNYFACGAPSEKEALGHLRSTPFVVDIGAGTANIPGTGDEPFVTTEIRDVGYAAAQACLLEEEWEPHMGWTVGERLTYNEVVQIAEEITGRKLKVNRPSEAEIKELSNPIGPNGEQRGALETFYWDVYAALLRGDADHEDVLGPKIHAQGREWKPITVREFISKWWAKSASSSKD